MRLLITAFLLLISNSVLADETDAVIQKAHDLLTQGQYYLAIDALQTRQDLSKTPEQAVRIEGLQGLVYYRMHRYEQADSALASALANPLATNHDRAQWAAVLANSMNQHGKTEKAQQLYAQALSFASNDDKLALGIRLEQTELLPPAQQLTALQALASQVNTLAVEKRLPYLLNKYSRHWS